MKPSREWSSEEREHFQACQAWLQVLQHKAIKDATDLKVLQDMAENALSERHRIRASEALLKARQQAAEKLAYTEAHREEIMKEKGLNKSTHEHVHKLDMGSLPLDKLRELAAGGPPTIEVEARVIDPEDSEDVLLEPGSEVE